jgi:hypothetical protein
MCEGSPTSLCSSSGPTPGLGTLGAEQGRLHPSARLILLGSDEGSEAQWSTCFPGHTAAQDGPGASPLPSHRLREVSLGFPNPLVM